MQLTKQIIRLSLLIFPALLVTVMSWYSLLPPDGEIGAQAPTPTQLVNEPPLANNNPERIAEPTWVPIFTESLPEPTLVPTQPAPEPTLVP